MDERPEWHVDIDLFGDNEVILARATLQAPRMTLVGRGVARMCPRLHSHLPMGDSEAVGAALHDLGRQLTGEAAQGSPRAQLARRQHHDHHAYRG